MKIINDILAGLKEGKVISTNNHVKVYENSLLQHGQTQLLMVRIDGEKKLLAAGEDSLFTDLYGEDLENGKVCDLTHENRLALNEYFPHTRPQAFGTKVPTFGLGDRLGLATAGHIQVIKDRNVKPILAQQSIRELTFTTRKMSDVIDTVVYAVIQEGYTGGYGADADHVKEEIHVKKALDLGFTMLTLDCSDYIKQHYVNFTESELEKEFRKLEIPIQEYYKNTYGNKTFDINGLQISLSHKELLMFVLIYHRAIEYIKHIYRTYIQDLATAFDFEVSIDEIDVVTKPEAHFFVANELKNKDVSITSLAPKFYGEFEKGIDYIGDIDILKKQLIEHQRVAEHFGYKLSVHSGSDKFSIYPTISEITNGIVHIKTSGTNWLEAIRVIASENPTLYRKLYNYSLDVYGKALDYYKITTSLSDIPRVEEKSDKELPQDLDHVATRQLFHITYGYILTERDDKGNYKYRHGLFETLKENEDVYEEYLRKHIGKHLDYLSL